MRSSAVALCTALAAVASGCPAPPAPDSFGYDVTPAPDDDAAAPTGPLYCSLGEAVPGAAVARGFCLRRYAGVEEPRVLAVAPNGDVFVAAPSMGTPGGASGGTGAILVLADDQHSGHAEVSTFADGLPNVHGLVIAGGFVYFIAGPSVWRTPYTMGLRREMPAMREQLGAYDRAPGARWTHGLAVSAGGAVFATQSLTSSSACSAAPLNGTIDRLERGALTTVASGFRNPMYIRCHPQDETCAAAELGDDSGGGYGAHEKIVLVRPNTNYGFPCCAGNGVSSPFNAGGYDCGGATREEATFPINDTPFGLDWEHARWPLPFHHAMFVALHGSFYSSPAWAGARIVFAATDPVTHAPTGPWLDFVRGFGPSSPTLRRPADVVFSPDGRLFFADDQGNAVYWVAPDTARMP